MTEQELLAQEQEWIICVREYNDSQALEHLIGKYLPLIERLRQMYNLQLFDREDWYQEARIICLTTCLLFNADKGSRFGSFYKLRLKNHITNLLRQQMATKRKSNINSISMDYLLLQNPDLENDWQPYYQSQTNISLLHLEFPNFVQLLSIVELQALGTILSAHQSETSEAYSQLQIKRAVSRSRRKMLLFYQDYSIDT